MTRDQMAAEPASVLTTVGAVRRVPLIHAGGLDAVVDHLCAAKDPITVILDIDNTIVAYTDLKESVVPRMEYATALLSSCSSVRRVVVVTNGPGREVEGAVARADKPFTSRGRLGLSRNEDCCVIGDQILTDGLLAWRLHAPFYQISLNRAGEPAWSRIQRKVGDLVRLGAFEERHI